MTPSSERAFFLACLYLRLFVCKTVFCGNTQNTKLYRYETKEQLNLLRLKLGPHATQGPRSKKPKLKGPMVHIKPNMTLNTIIGRDAVEVPLKKEQISVE